MFFLIISSYLLLTNSYILASWSNLGQWISYSNNSQSMTFNGPVAARNIFNQSGSVQMHGGVDCSGIYSKSGHLEFNQRVHCSNGIISSQTGSMTFQGDISVWGVCIVNSPQQIASMTVAQGGTVINITVNPPQNAGQPAVNITLNGTNEHYRIDYANSSATNITADIKRAHMNHLAVGLMIGTLAGCSLCYGYTKMRSAFL